MSGLLQKRREFSKRRLEEFKGALSDAESRIGNNGCIYVTGSFARGEASEHSDLDLFILSEKHGDRRFISNIDEILIKANLIEQAKQLKFPPFSGDGKFLVIHSSDDLTNNIGQPEDDYVNTFTARMLLLLESKVLFDHGVYEKLVKQVIASYWRDFEDNRDKFIPGFLVNDILRLWRTFCINYEAEPDPDKELNPKDPIQKAKRKVKNYKLKHSRLLTCFSAVAYLLKVYHDQRTVTPDDAWKMVQLTPTERLEYLQRLPDIGENTIDIIDQAFYHYERFLTVTGIQAEQVVDRFKSNIDDLKPYAFGDTIYKLLGLLDEGLMHRIITI